jgi:16S rRNA (guanine527-N7)-methyltransferase
MTQRLETAQIGPAIREAVAARLADFGFTANADLLERLGKFAMLLALWGSKLNLTASPNDPDATAFHIVDSLMPLILAAHPENIPLAGIFDQGVRVLDLGSGAGFPALILAAATHAHFTMLEARRKRASFLAVAASEMRLDNARVDSNYRADSDLEPSYDVVTARAFAEPVVAIRTASAALKPGGRLLLYLGASQQAEVVAAFASVPGFDTPETIAYELKRQNCAIAHLLVVARRVA